MEKARWEFTAFPELESLKSFEETQCHILVSDKQRKGSACPSCASTTLSLRLEEGEMVFLKIPTPPQKKKKCSQKSLDTASLAFPMGLDKDYPPKGIFVCMQVGFFQEKRQVQKMGIVPKEDGFFLRQKSHFLAGRWRVRAKTLMHF